MRAAIILIMLALTACTSNKTLQGAVDYYGAKQVKGQ